MLVFSIAIRTGWIHYRFSLLMWDNAYMQPEHMEQNTDLSVQAPQVTIASGPVQAIPTAPNQGFLADASETPVLQRYFALFMLVAAFWLTFGRALLGSGGWITFIMMFSVAPVLAIYGVLQSVIFSTRHKRTGYKISRITKCAIVCLLVSLFLFGFTLIDGGDTRDSVRSAFSNIFGVNGASNNTALLTISSTVASISALVALVLALCIFVYSFFDGRQLFRKKV